MNELQLSNDLTTIETEIKTYQNLAGQSIFEIGRRLKHVKENDLAHGEFGKWLEKVDVNHRVAQKMIKIASNPELNTTMSSHLGMEALYEIATLPEPERTKEHVTSNGETKTPDEMTVRELRELKKQLKQRDEQNAQLQSQVEQAQRSEEIALKQLEEAENREPEVVERYSEPKDYQEAINKSEELERKNRDLEQQIKFYKNHSKRREEDKVLEEKDKHQVTDARIEINRDNASLEPEVRKAIRHESSADAFISAAEEIVSIFDNEVEDVQLFEKYISTLNYKALSKAEERIKKIREIGGYK
ncbi:DUF3102 domain-containing protein [Staphylococcus intermedius]|uniref:DUF3102 domain-containing protein n=1 Tax=Staphylococcus intermedius TaxID=1285 RepID=UPI000BD40D9C|nr:DUF3102 domain-containing protein [Staphylococcus intermedius]PCF64540.1 hypothetical protein B5C04_00390 [Staphylococcus intermedius]PCF81499.1 hypothetical protein B4W70_00390 [Staphylococcus intermedius]